MTAPSADEALAEAHRLLFGRLVGWLFRACGDLQLAEDTVATAFANAVPAWRTRGVPDSPEAWLRVAARNRLRSALTRAERTVALDEGVLDDVPADDTAAPAMDDRLALLLVCAHPAIDARLHAPLMLQALLGVDAARIARVYLVPPATMGQRLSRAKAKIRDAGIRWRIPDRGELSLRLPPVLQAVYGAYGIGASIGEALDGRDDALRAEALRLSEVIVEEIPDAAEAWGLRALLLHAESRAPGRIVDGRFIPLPDQDTSRWSADLRAEADACLRRAGAAFGGMGRFQLEAAISAAHSARADGVPVAPADVLALYDGLLRIAPSIGARVSAAAAHVRFGDPDTAEALLRELPEGAVRTHQPYWVTRAEVAAARADRTEATRAMDVAIGLTLDPAVRDYLVSRRLAL